MKQYITYTFEQKRIAQFLECLNRCPNVEAQKEYIHRCKEAGLI